MKKRINIYVRLVIPVCIIVLALLFKNGYITGLVPVAEAITGTLNLELQSISSQIRTPGGGNIVHVDRTDIPIEVDAVCPIGTITNTGPSRFIRIVAYNLQSGTINYFSYVFEGFAGYKAGGTTTWVQLPIRSGMGDQPRRFAIDARLILDGSFIELRLRRLGGSAIQGVGMDIQTTGVFAADTSACSLGGTYATGFLGSLAYDFPAGLGFFEAGYDGLFIKETGNVGIGTTSPLAKLDVRKSTDLGPQSNPRIAARGGYNNLEFGHPNQAGYGSTLGYLEPNGNPFLAFNAESDGSGNTYRTRGLVGLILQSDLAGGLQIGRATNSNLSGQSLTTDMIIKNGNVGIGTTTPGSVAPAKLELYGTVSNPAGPHIVATTTSDVYPVFQQLNWSHDNVALNFDSYYDNINWKSADVGSNFQIYKINDQLRLNYGSGAAAGGVVTWNNGIVLTAAGNVGIGTTTPGSPLSVAGQVRITNAAGTSRFTIEPTSSGTNNLWNFDNDAGTLRIYREDYAASGIGANGSVKMAILNDGNVGIGTTTPDSPLKVSAAYSEIKISSTGTNAWAQLQLTPSGLGNSYLVYGNNLLFYQAAIGNVGVFDSSGRLGIGTTAPESRLHIEGSGATRGQIALTQSTTVATDSEAGIFWHGVGAADTYAIHRTAGAWTANTYQQLNIDFPTGIILEPGTGDDAGYDKSYVEITRGKGLRVTQGNVGIGTTVASQKLDVQSTGVTRIRMTSGADNSVVIDQTDGTQGWEIGSRFDDTIGADANRLTFQYTGGAAQVSIQPSDGNVGIGTTTPELKLDVEGDIEVGTGTTGCVRDSDNTTIAGTCSSDIRLKTNIQPIKNVLEKLIQLQPVTFDWKDKSNQTPNYGLIAQEVEKVLPELVQEGEDGYKRVSYDTSLSMMTIAAIKEQQAQINSLSTIISAQQQQIDELKRAIDKLQTK